MIRITRMLIFFGTICSISIIGIASSIGENLSQTSQCTQPINYTISLEIQNTSLIVNSTVVLNVSCPLPYIQLNIGRYCDIKLNVQTDIQYNFYTQWKPSRLLLSDSLKHRYDRLDINLRNIQEEREKVTLKHGFYKINSICNCSLEEVVDVFITYINQTETKEFLILPRIPNEWIFPYWENPATKARFIIQIKHKHNDTVLSNMPVAETFGTHTRHTVFFTTRPISTHLVALVVIPHIHKTNNETKNNVTIINSKMINGTLYAQKSIRNITRLIRNMWNDIISLSHVNYVLLPITVTHYESIITSGLVLISEAHIMYDIEADSIVKEREVTCLIARNVIQEMFSDWLATFRQSDSWFIEGFSTIYGVYIRDQYYNTSLLKSSVIQTRRNCLNYAEAISKYDFPIQENSSITRNSTLRKLWREKAFNIFYMLNTVFEQDFLYISMFKEAVNLYYNTFTASINTIFSITISVVSDNTSNNTYNELSILDKLWNKDWNFKVNSLYKFPYLKSKDIKSMITSWTSQIGYPLVQVKRHNDTQSVSAMIIDCFDVDYKKPCKEKWWIPVTFKKILNMQVIATRYHVLKPDGKSIFTSLFDKNQITIVVDHPGYRINYDRESWKHIAFFLKNVNPKTVALSDVTLAHVLDDAYYFLVQNTKYNENSASDKIYDLDIYLELASSIFNANNSYTAWYPVLIALENMSKNFLFPENVLFQNIKKKLLEILNKFLDDTSYTHHIHFSKNSVSNQFYHEVLKWTCILGSSKCKDHVSGILKWHFKHPAQNKLLLSWQKWIYCQGLMLETVTYDMSALWQTIYDIYQTQGKKEEFFKFLPCSRQNKNLYIFLSLLDRNFVPTPGGSFKAKKSVTVTLLFNIFALNSKNNSALNIILFGLESEIGRDVNILAILNCIINNIYSDEGLSKITEQLFLQKLVFINLSKPFVFEAIKKKVENRRSFLGKMQNTIRFKP